jgi:hypothetical protein
LSGLLLQRACSPILYGDSKPTRALSLVRGQPEVMEETERRLAVYRQRVDLQASGHASHRAEAEETSPVFRKSDSIPYKPYQLD